ncbi:MAG TPA: CHAT domain-containing protein [Chitinophagaceae bacterium]|nr:CHAT domain-containing protein [Chitinophagaceae bacterium]
MIKRIFLFAFIFFLTNTNTRAQSLKKIIAAISTDFQTRNFSSAIQTGDSVLHTLSKTKRSEQKEYAFLSFITGSAYLETGQLDKAGQPLSDAVELYRKLDKQSSIYGIACNNLGSLYNRIGQYAKAVSLLMESLEVTRALSAGYSDNLFPAYLNLSDSYKGMGRHVDAISLLLDLKKILPPENPTHNLALKSSLVSIFTDLGDFEKAESGIGDMLEYAKTHFSNSSREFAKTTLVASKYYYILKDYDKAEQLADKAITILDKYPETDESEMPTILTNLAYIYYFTGRTDRADSLFSQNMTWFKQNTGETSPLYTSNCNGKALTLIAKGQANQAISLLQKVMSIQEELKNENSVIYGILLNNLAIAYPKVGQVEKSEPALLRSLDIAEKLFGKDHPEYKNVCFNLAALYWDINRPKEALHYYKTGMEIIRNQVRQVFSFSSEEEKLQFRNTFAIDRNKYYSFIFQEEIKELSGDVYDNNLYSKGLLLNSIKQINADIINSKDPTAQQLYTKWQNSKKQLAYWYSKPIRDRQINIDSLKQKAETQEKQLARFSSAFQKNQEAINVDWKTVQQQLQPGEAAIEFTEFYYFDKARYTDSIIYAALVIKKDGNTPQWVTLFEEKQLDSLMKIKAVNDQLKVNQFYSSQHNSLYDLVWAAIDKKLDGIETVYYSPIGLLNKVSFAAIPVNEKKLLIDKYHLIQLNSTKELLEDQKIKITPSDALVLYGGIAYDADSTLLKKITGNKKTDAGNEGTEIINNGAQSWNYLPSSKLEVEAIQKMGVAQHYKIALISDENATEESLKSLDGNSSPAVLHIASHGFFFPDPKDKKPLNSQQTFKQSTNPLLRSGLFFAGAFYTWTKNKNVSGLEDGIATAYEIANMYLPNTKLCVLSACETGLGDLYGSEGVLGLQRAFRIAGVKNLVMSLWKVPDTETAEFMALFYDHIFRQQTIADAFQAAQSAMKNKYRDDPYKWAAFILVR